MANKLLITGGNGLLASELKKHLKKAIYIDIEDMDITNLESIKAGMNKYDPDVVVHLAAFTDVAGSETNKKDCYRVNVWGTEQLARRSPVFIYMSTEYVFDGEKGYYHENHIPNPVNFYALTKLLGERAAESAKRYSVIRTLFKPRPYPHQMVPTDMWTSGDYVDVMAEHIATAINHAHELPKLIHIGEERKNLFELAKESRPEVKPIKRLSLPIRLPRDTSLDCSMWEMLNYDSRFKANH